jgi:tetrahydromethanopterin S-methyltransferase subunit C
MAGYYDFVLGLIPIALAGITAVLTVFGFGLTTAVPMAAVVSLGIIGHAMFVSPPVDTQASPGLRSQS